MNLLLFKNIDKIKFEVNPKISKEKFNLSGIKLSLTLKIAAIKQKSIIIII